MSVAYRFFRRKLVEAEDPADPQDVLRIEQAITSRLTLVAVTAEAGDNVHRIFESLNNTGLKLSQADLLRNYLFMRLPTRGELVYETYWLPLQASLSNKELEQLMWLQLVLDGDDRVRRQDLYAAQQHRFEQTEVREADIEAYVKELHRRSMHFRKVVRPDEEGDPAVRAHLRRLDAWEAAATYPALMLLLDRRERGETDSAETARALSYIESFLVRRTVCRVPPNNLNRIFQSVPAQLPLDVPVADGLRQLLSASNRYWPDDDELREKFRTAPFYLYGLPEQRKLVLQRLEESYDHPEPVDFAAAKLSIEHVLPQSAGDDWLQVLAEDAIDGETPQDVHARLQHTLGNLTLTAQNSELSNHPFDRKQDLLHSSHLEMNRRIAATDRWGAREIGARADELAERALALWPSPLRGVGRAERSRDWQLVHQVLAALPHGTWTSYGDLAAYIGSGAQAVGNHLAQTAGVVQAYRVLNAEGRIADGFRWGRPAAGGRGRTGATERRRHPLHPDRGRGPRAAPDQHRPGTAAGRSRPGAVFGGRGRGGARRSGAGGETRAERFLRQLAADDTPETVDAVRTLLARWEELGGWVGYGAYQVTTSAFLMLGAAGLPGAGIWPLVLYPGGGRGGSAEVVFQYLATREPFTDRPLRAELLGRVNGLDGVDIPEGKLDLRPNFRLALLEKDGNRDALAETLTWFRDRWIGRDMS